jgi:hypothetical protein
MDSRQSREWIAVARYPLDSEIQLAEQERHPEHNSA